MSEDFHLPTDTPGVPPEWGSQIGEIMYTTEQIQARVAELGKEISEHYAGERIIAVGLLKGSAIFMADLLRHLTVPVKIDFMVVSSYVDTETTGNVIMKKDIEFPIEGAHVLIVEDLIDTGTTLKYVLEHIAKKNPASLKVCTFLNKVERRKCEIDVAFNGFIIPDRFVIGYGMDFNEDLRTIPFIGVLKPSAYRK